MLWKRYAVADEALEVDGLGVLEEQIACVVCKRFTAALSDTEGGLRCSARDPRAEALVVVEDVLVGEVLLLAEGHDVVVWIGRKHSGFEVWHSP